MLEDYLGDGVYVKFDGYQIWIAANDRVDSPNNTGQVALEESVFAALLRFAELCKLEVANADGK